MDMKMDDTDMYESGSDEYESGSESESAIPLEQKVLFFSAERGDYEMVKMMADAGVNLSSRFDVDGYRYSALHNALEIDSESCWHCSAKRGWYYSFDGVGGRHPKDVWSLIKLLVTLENLRWITDRDCLELWECTTEFKDLEIQTALLDTRPLFVQSADVEDFTEIFKWAIRAQSIPWVSHLCSIGVQRPDFEGGMGRDYTAEQRDIFRFSLDFGSFEIVEILLHAGLFAVSGVRDKDGKMSLHIAAEKGYTKVVRRLVEAGADITVRDGSGRTPLELANKNGHGEVIDVLLSAQFERTSH